MPKITLTRPSVYESEGVRLMPGVNDVSDDDLAALNRNKIVRADMSAGILQVGHVSKPEPVAEPAPAPVKNETDTDALIELARGDGRTTEVREAREALEGMGIDWDE